MTAQECRPYFTWPWIAAYCTGAAMWALIAGLLGWTIVVGLFAFGVLCAAGAGWWLHTEGDR